MANDKDNTPEKELLRLIEGSKPGASAAGGPSGGGSRRGRRSSLSFGAIRGALFGRFSFFRRSAQKKLSTGKAPAISFSFVNHTLTAVAAALTIYLLSDAGASAIQLGKPVNLTIPGGSAKAEHAAAGGTSPLNDSAYYLQRVSSRDIFKEGGKPEPKAEAAPEPVSVEDNPATSGLSLVGISWSANPDVIIEDKDRKRTYFVKRGQTVGDGVKIEAVFKDHVVLSYEGREFELR